VPIDTMIPGSPGWWLDRLIKRLAERQGDYDRLERYSTGDPDMPEASHRCRQAYQRLIRMSRMNYGELVVEAVRERMMVTGFRSGVDQSTDDLMWRIWQANSLDADQALVDRPALGMGDAYSIVGPVDPDIGAPVITLEDPRQVITEHDPIRRRKITAALKVYRDDITGMDVAWLYLPRDNAGPGRVYRATRQAQQQQVSLSAGGFEFQTVAATGVDRVPVVRHAYMPRGNPLLPGKSEVEGVMDTLDRINHMILQRVVIATAQAFRQRGVKGVPTVDQDGQEIDYSDVFAPDPGAMWLLPETADIWESQQVDLSPVLASVRDDVKDLAAQSRTPLYYLTPSETTAGSAEGASLSREGLIHKTLDRIAQAGESWEHVMSLAFEFAQLPLPVGHEVVWQPPERHSLAERADAAVKAQAAGVPWRTVMTDIMQYTPTQVARMEAERAAEAFLNLPPADDEPVPV
jgi:hypothetical protein